MTSQATAVAAEGVMAPGDDALVRQHRGEGVVRGPDLLHRPARAKMWREKKGPICKLGGDITGIWYIYIYI